MLNPLIINKIRSSRKKANWIRTHSRPKIVVVPSYHSAEAKGQMEEKTFRITLAEHVLTGKKGRMTISVGILIRSIFIFRSVLP